MASWRPSWPSFAVAQIGYPTAVMEWRFDQSARILEVTFNGGEAPSRDEVGAFLRQVEPLVSSRAVQMLLINGKRVTHRRPLAYGEIASPMLYEAARRRSLRIPSPHLAKG
jgi:hypothetical protein